MEHGRNQDGRDARVAGRDAVGSGSHKAGRDSAEASVPPFALAGRGEERQPGAQGGRATIDRILDLAAKERVSAVDMAQVGIALHRRVDQVRLHKALCAGQSLLIAAEREGQQRGAVAMTMRLLKLTEDRALYCVMLAVAELRGQLLVERGVAPLTLVEAEIAAGIRDVCGVPRAEFARCVGGCAGGCVGGGE